MGRGGMMKSVVVAVIMLMVMKGTSAKTLKVGDADGWKIPSSPNFYSAWAAKQTFAVGDTLDFQFVGSHTVATVFLKEAYDKCDPTLDTKSIISTSSPTEHTLTEGQVYFFCTIGTHCASGQKLAVTVTGTGSGPGPIPVPSGPPATDQSPPAPGPNSSPDHHQPSPSPVKDSAPKPVALTWATLSLFIGAMVLAFGYF